MIRIILGFILFVFLVFRPIQANLIAATALHNNISPQDQAKLLYEASKIQSCEVNILNALGDAYVITNNPIMATVSYGNAIVCSPANSLMRLKYGEAMLLSGFNGLFSVKDAITLEPNSPLYNQEYNRLTKLQLP